MHVHGMLVLDRMCGLRPVWGSASVMVAKCLVGELEQLTVRVCVRYPMHVHGMLVPDHLCGLRPV